MLNDKKFQRIEKVLGKDTIQLLDQESVEGLQVKVTQSQASIKQACDELEANPKYQELKESLKALSQGLREVKTHQNAVAQYSLHLLEEKGAVNE